jgi:phage baseplate assembly protein W
MANFTKFPIEVDNSGIITGQSYIDSIKQQIKFIILTNPGERTYKPSYGIGIKSYLFENIARIGDKELRYDLFSKISKQFETYLTNVAATSVDVSQVDNRLQIYISFSVNNYIEDSLIVEV